MIEGIGLLVAFLLVTIVGPKLMYRIVKKIQAYMSARSKKKANKSV